MVLGNVSRNLDALVREQDGFESEILREVLGRK
jgi:hypothetical protein